jgi:hypothetical protein
MRSCACCHSGSLCPPQPSDTKASAATIPLRTRGPTPTRLHPATTACGRAYPLARRGRGPDVVGGGPMPFFSPIRATADLPPPAGATTRASESERCEFKQTYAPQNHREMAKDMAAFANAMGGAIIIGTTSDDAPLGYPGLPPAFAETLSNEFDLTLRSDLSPKPLVERCLVDSPLANGNVVLAINVDPYPDQVVGARDGGDSWRFPVRTGAQTTYRDPAMLPLFDARSRRAAILLDRIPAGALVSVSFQNTAGVVINPSGLKTFVGVDSGINVVKLENRQQTPHVAEWYPLDQVLTVYLSAERVWRVKILV